jgi:hypothetical protein
MEHDIVGFSQARYEAATAACSMLVGLYRAFEQELGRDRAVAILETHADSLGHSWAQQLSQMTGGRVPTVSEIAEFMTTASTGFGCTFSCEEQPQAVTMRFENCPMAGAYAALGLDRDTGRQFCQAYPIRAHAEMCKAVGWWFENTDYRKGWDGVCVEVMRKA